MVLQNSPLLKAARLFPADVRIEETGIDVADVLEYLKHDEWELALLLLEDLGDAHPQPPEFWSLLTDAARLMWLMSDVAWYQWRHNEARNGGIRAELCLVLAESGGRATPIPPSSGILRPMWDIGHLTSAGEPLLSIARLWVEGPDPLEPGGCSLVRLLPLTFEHWQHLKPGDLITMHEMRPLAGRARVIEIIQPVTADGQLGQQDR
ncbi:hypothetical protein [Microbispora rosea]|uniref:hypothetical protein n=1 Tax=Microbispora rosea TaxID=58117 RepID=UPI003D9329E2